MKKKTFLIMIALFAATSWLWSQDISGNWQGELHIMGQKLRIIFHIEKKDTLYTTIMDSPDQGAYGLPTDRTGVADNQLEIVAAGMGILYRGKLENDSITGIFSQGGISIPLTLQRAVSVLRPQRPQTPEPPYPYRIEEVTIENKQEGLTLAGTLTFPETIGPFPALVLIAGSGPNDRDETIFGHRPFLVLADHLTRNGFAVLRYDKRGIGASKGEYTKATTDDFAQDAAAAVAFLRSRKDIDKRHINLIGHSEGGIIASMVAANDKKIDGIILLAGMGMKGIDLIMAQNENGMSQQNLEPENREKMAVILRETLETLSVWQGTPADQTALNDRLIRLWEATPLLVRLKQNREQFLRSNFNAMVTPWYRRFLQIDPETFLKKVSCPVLALNGEKDTQVRAEENLTAIESALKEGKNRHITVQRYPELNHLFQECTTGQADEYAVIEETFSPTVLNDILSWLQETGGTLSSGK